MTPAETHPVSAEILGHIGAGSFKGNKLRDRFMGSPYGWSNETVLATVAVLFACGQLRVATAAGQALPPGKFLERDFNQYDLSRENTPLSLADKRAVARLTKLKPDDAEIEAPRYVAKLKANFAQVAGAAPQPAPVLPPLLDELDKLSGKDLVKRLALEEKAVQQLATDLENQIAAVHKRLPRWNDLVRLVAFLGHHAEAPALQTEMRAVLDGRQLLASPDPVPDLLHRATDALCGALNTAHTDYARHYEQAVDDLHAGGDWQRLAQADQAAIRAQTGLTGAEATPRVATLEELLASLAQCTPERWQERRDAVAGKLQQARALCAHKLEPKVQAIAVPQRIVRSEAELDAWLAEVRTSALAKLAAGPVQF
jgi:hypothetical protein